MIEHEPDRSALSRLVGSWHGTMLHRAAADEPFQEMPGTSENRWVLGGRFVEMTLRAAGASDSWSAVFYIGYERNERRHVLVSLEPGDRRVTTRRGEWTADQAKLMLTSHQSRAICDTTAPGVLKLEFVEETRSGEEFVRMQAVYGTAAAPAAVRAPSPRTRRFVIA